MCRELFLYVAILFATTKAVKTNPFHMEWEENYIM